jgi:hypothetical protein
MVKLSNIWLYLSQRETRLGTGSKTVVGWPQDNTRISGVSRGEARQASGGTLAHIRAKHVSTGIREFFIAGILGR